jgi:tetratricopeptide (TPR) repeat protein
MSPTSRRWVLHGAGGKGKTAIAYQFALQVKRTAPEPYSAVWWLSAKKRRFLEGLVIPIEHPDFSGVETAIDKILFDYGWIEYIGRPLQDKKGVLLELLNSLPSLLVVDDIDTLEGQDELAVEFFTLEVPTTRSKVLLTSRRKLTGLGATATEVRGFAGEEGYRFVASRIKLFGLDPQGFTKAVTGKILKATEGSPLYIDDLLRYCATGRPLNEVISLWERENGDSAREYALRREYEMLSPEAKTVLLACSVWQGPCTYDDVRALANLGEGKTDKAVDELQRLFLVPKPEIIAGLHRFDVNPSVRSLVTKIMNSTEIFRRVEAARKALKGELPSLQGRKIQVAATAREVVSLVKLGRQEQAERLLKGMLEKYPEDPDLLGQMGWVYQRWKPAARGSDSRDCFARAAQLHCHRLDLYWHWWMLECDQSEWPVAARAAQGGLEVFPNNPRLLYCEGYARSRLGRSLRLSFSPERAWTEHTNAQELLENALVPIDNLDQGDYQHHGAVLRAIVLNLEGLIDTARVTERGETPFIKKLGKFLLQWEREHPGDLSMQSEKARLFTRFSDIL